MIVTKISSEYTIKIPDEFRDKFAAGQEVAISQDKEGRLMLTPTEDIRAILMQTFGMWADRTDISQDSVEYVNEVRRGQRLDELGLTSDETD